MANSKQETTRNAKRSCSELELATFLLLKLTEGHRIHWFWRNCKGKNPHRKSHTES